jgi:hypothetical protein
MADDPAVSTILSLRLTATELDWRAIGGFVWSGPVEHSILRGHREADGRFCRCEFSWFDGCLLLIGLFNISILHHGFN